MSKKTIANLILAFGLIGLLVFIGYNIWQNHFTEKKPAEIKILPETIKPVAAAVEIGKTEDGQQVATFLSYPKYYQDETGEFKEVETAVVKNDAEDVKLPSGQVADWKVDKGVWKFYATNDGAVAADNAGIQLETKLKALVYFDAETKKIYPVRSADSNGASTIYSRDTQQVVVQPVVAQNQIIWPSILEGIDYKITYINDLLKEEIVMSDAVRQKLPTPESLGIPSDRAYLGFLFERPKEQIGGLKTFVVESQGPTSAGLRSDLEGKGGRREVEYGNKAFETEGSVEFMDAEGNKIQTIEPGFVALNQVEAQVEAKPRLEGGKQLPLLKRFYKDNPGEISGKKLFFSGSKHADIQNLGSGDLLFDPTVSFQDMIQSSTDASFTLDADLNVEIGLDVGYNLTSCSDDNYCRALIRFPNFSGTGTGQVPESATVTNAYLSLYHYQNTGSTTVDAYKMLDQWNGDEYTSVYNYTYAQDGGTTTCINDGDGITSSESSVAIDNCSGSPINPEFFPEQGLLKIDDEIIWYTSHDSTGFSGLIRGVSGTAAASHADNAVVDGQISWVESGGSDGPSGNSVGSLLDSESLSSLGWKNFDVTSAAQDWTDDPTSNFGVLLKQSDAIVGSKLLADSDYANPSLRPKLTIAYTTGESGEAGLVNAYESADTAVSPSSPGTATTAQNFARATEAEDSAFWTTALSTTDNGYDSQVFKMQVPSAASTSPITVNWQGHGESESAGHPVSLNIWNFNSSAWEELDSGDARYNDTFTNRTTELNAVTSWGTQPISALALDSVNGVIYIGGGTILSEPKFAKYNTSLDSFTNLTSKINAAGCQWFPSARSVLSLAFDPNNKEIYLGGEDGNLCKYNTAQDSMTDLNAAIDSVFGSTIDVISLVFDSAKNTIYLGGQSGKFAKYDPATGVATDLTSKISSFWSTNPIRALTFDSANKTIYLGGDSGKFSKYDPATGVVTDLTSKISSFWSTYPVTALSFNSASNTVYLAGTTNFSEYNPSLDSAENLWSVPNYPATLSSGVLNTLSFDSFNKLIYAGGNAASIFRHFPETRSSQSLTNTAYDAFGGIALRATAFDATNKVLYFGGESGKFGKYAVPSNTTLSGSVSSNIENYRDASGYAWLWVKATNEFSPPSLSSISAPSGGTTTTATWTSGEGADGALAYATSTKASWDAYTSFAYESDAGWKTSHSLTFGTTCDPPTTYYYRVRSCDSWGSCTVSAEQTTTTTDCGGGSCPFLFSWDGEKYDFQTDIISSGKMGLPAGKDGRRKPNADDYYFLKDETLEAEGGRYKFKLTEERDEMDYLDNLKLYYVDHAPNLEVYTDQIRIGQERKGVAPAIYTVDKTALKKPASCTDYYGNDCLEKIAVSDNDYTAPGQLYRWDTMEMDLGDLRDSENIKLVLRSFQAVAGTFENQPAYDKNIHGPMPDVSFKLEVKNEKGEWQNIDVKNLSLSPTEFPRTYVADLTGVFLTDDYRMRLSYYNDTRFDYVAIDTSENAPVELREVELEKAELGNRLAISKKDMEIGPYEPQYEQEIKDKKNLAFSGNFTKYGNVEELLDSKDDRFLIFQKPDELDVEFRSAPDLSEGLERDFMLYSSGFYKVAKYGIAPTVDPLPFNAMSNYPYPEGEYPYKDDTDYQDYLDTWNTRRVEKGQKPSDFADDVPTQLENILEKGKNFLQSLNLEASLPSGKKVVREYTMHAENSNGSADTDYIEMSVDSVTRLKGGVTLPGGVRLK